MSIINRIQNTKNAIVLTALVSCATQIQTFSSIPENHVNQQNNQSVIYIADSNNRNQNPFRRPKTPGGGQFRTIDEMNQTQT